MKTKNFIYSIFLITTFMFYGCNQEETADLCTDYYCSSVVKTTKIDNQLNYKLYFYLRTYAPVSEINLTGPEGTFNLNDEINPQINIYEYPKTFEFGKQEPTEGTWFYNIQFTNGQVKIISANVSKPFLLPVENVNVAMSNDGSINITWDAVENADYYEIKIQGSLSPIKIVPEDKIYTVSIDLFEFFWEVPDDLTFEITAFHVKGNPEKITSVSSAFVNYHIE